MNTSHWFRRSSVGILFCSWFLAPSILHCQEPALLAGEAVSEPIPTQATVGSSGGRDVSLRKLPQNFLSDQKDLWLFPGSLAHGRHWLPAVAVAGVTPGLLAADPHDVSYFRRTTSFHAFNQAFSGKITALEIGLVPASFYVIGLGRKDTYSQTTALFAGEALADSFVLYGVINAVSRRLRPSDIAPQDPLTGTFFRAHNGLFGHSFPSGHSIEAFSVATIFGRRYRTHRWVLWVAYGAAGAIGISRVTLQSHFPADVFLGAALGYCIGRFDVLRGR